MSAQKIENIQINGDLCILPLVPLTVFKTSWVPRFEHTLAPFVGICTMIVP